MLPPAAADTRRFPRGHVRCLAPGEEPPRLEPTGHPTLCLGRTWPVPGTRIWPPETVVGSALVAYSSTTIDDLGEEPFRKVRRALGITAFGANVLVIPPGAAGRSHYHDLQDELYFVHRGRAIFDFPDERIELGPGGLVHVEATTPRRVTNAGRDELVMLIVGGKDGYVGRDGKPANPKSFLRDTGED
jgi:mannose-6-phosphate isomerase-like protein (cupin superfamily)